MSRVAREGGLEDAGGKSDGGSLAASRAHNTRRVHSGIGTGEVRCKVAVQVVPTEARMIMAIALH